MSGGDQEPAASTGFLVVLTEFSLRKHVEVVRQNAAASPRSKPSRGVWGTTQGWMNLTVQSDADLVLVPLAASHLRAHTMLLSVIRHLFLPFEKGVLVEGIDGLRGRLAA